MIIEELVKLFLQFNGKRIASREHALEAAQVRVFHALHAQHRLIERRHAGNEVAAVFHDLLGVILGIDARDQNTAAPALQHRVDAHAKSEAVEHRHGREHLVAGAEHWVGRDDLGTERVEVFVCHHDALGLAGRAAGVQNNSRVFSSALDLVIIKAGLREAYELVPADDRRLLGDLPDLAAFRQHVTRLKRLGQRVLDARDDDVDDLCVAADTLEFVVKLVQGDRRHAFGLVEIKFDLFFGGERMDHIGDRTDKIDGIEHIDRLWAVR